MTAPLDLATSTHSRHLSSPANHVTILLVEDEDAVRRVAGEVLQNVGYSVIDAKSGGQALQLIETLQSPPDVLITDVVMPVMNGPELAAKLFARLPHLRTVFISGYTQDALPSRRIGGHAPRALYLRKPFSVEALTRIVARALEADQGARVQV